MTLRGGILANRSFSCCELSAVNCRPASIHHATEGGERLPREGVARLNFQCFLETFHRARVHFFAEIGAAQIVMGEMARLIAARFYRALEPGNRFVKTVQLNEIRSNIVVWIAEFRVNFNGAFALGDGVVNTALKMIGPSKKCISLGRRMQVERGLVKLDSPFVIPFHLGLISVLKDFPGSCQGFLAHGVNC